MILSELIKQLAVQLKSMNKDVLKEFVRKRLRKYNKKIRHLEPKKQNEDHYEIGQEIIIASAIIKDVDTIQEIMFPAASSSILELQCDAQLLKFIKEHLHNLQGTNGTEDPKTINLFGVFYSFRVVSALYTELQRLSNMLSLFVKENPELILEQPEDTVESFKSLTCLERDLTLLPQKEDWNLYIQTPEGVNLLNIGKLSEGPRFKVVCPDVHFPIGIKCISVRSKCYMVGGMLAQSFETEICENMRMSIHLANHDVFPFYSNGLSFDPTQDIIPSLPGPKVDPIVVALKDKVYVLATKPGYGCMLEITPFFEVFDPIHCSWDRLPEPPFYNKCSETGFVRPEIITHYAWGHKLVICLYGCSWVFDIIENKWSNDEDANEKKLPVLDGVAEFEEFLIAMPSYSDKLVAYKLSSNDFPELHRELIELQDLFPPGLRSASGLIIPFGGANRFCFINSSLDMKGWWWVCVAVFHLRKEENTDGLSKLTAVLESRQFYKHLDCPVIESAFVVYDDMHMHNLDADACFMKPKDYWKTRQGKAELNVDC